MRTWVRAGVILAVLAAAGGCNRNAVPMTECLNGAPAVPRADDVAPPTCSPVLPGAGVTG